jgi:hypothetical protein
MVVAMLPLAAVVVEQAGLELVLLLLPQPQVVMAVQELLRLSLVHQY